MTNVQIVMNESIKLMNAGIIGTTGNMMTVEKINEDGTREVVEMLEPEAIHTYATWKKLGYQVQKGEKAVAQFTIWKHVSKKSEIQSKNAKGETVTTEYDDNKMFMKKASWFKFSQVAPIQ